MLKTASGQKNTRSRGSGVSFREAFGHSRATGLGMKDRAPSGKKMQEGAQAPARRNGPEKGLVTADINSASCTVAVRATPHEGETIEGALHGKGSAVDLKALAGKMVRLSMRAQGPHISTGEPTSNHSADR